MQTVSPTFHQKSQAGIRKHKWSILLSFDRDFDDSRTFFTLDSSVLDDVDVLAPVDDNPIQYWDFYSYTAYTDRLMSVEWDREIGFPYSIQSSNANIVFNNIDNFFSSNTNSPITQYLKPSRPIKILNGFEGETLLQQFVGLTQDKPELDQTSRTAKFVAFDYLTELFKLKLSESVALTNVRTDEALAALFEQFGLQSYQYSLARGRNVIPFLFLEEGKSAADAFRDVMQAEGGQLWIDEQGIIRFDQRLITSTGPVFTFNESSISSISTTGDTEIVNRVKITSNIREAQESQPIHSGSGQLTNPTLTEPLLIPALGYINYEIKLDSPLVGYSEPSQGVVVGDSWFTVATLSGGEITSGVEVSNSELTQNTLIITLHNTNSYNAYLNAIQVYGEPAKIIDTIIYEAFDQDSINTYGEHLLEINNDMFGSEANCESFAYTMIDAYSEFDSIIEISVKSNPSLQLGDIIWVDTTKIEGQFQIIKIADSISSSGVKQVIKAKRYNPREWFILDISNLDETDVLAP